MRKQVIDSHGSWRKKFRGTVAVCDFGDQHADYFFLEILEQFHHKRLAWKLDAKR
jgi:hypothetical protein